MAELETYLFVHIPKTAGTSFRLGVEAAFGADRVVYDYGLDFPVTSDVVRKHVYQQRDLAKLKEHLIERRIAILSGHVAYKKYAPIFPADRVIAFVRDPMTRLVAEHRHAVRLGGFEGSLLDFAAKPRKRNIQSTMLKGAGVAKACFVGVTERYEDSLGLLNERLGWSVPHLVRNLNPERKRLALDYDLPGEQLVRLTGWNQADLKLYNRAVAALQKALPEPTEAAAGSDGLPRGVLGRYAGGQVVGWAHQIGCDRSVSVQVLVDGVPKRTVIADRPRPDLKERGLHPTGHAGFAAEVGELEPGTEIRCFIEEAGYELANSPLITR